MWKRHDGKCIFFYIYIQCDLKNCLEMAKVFVIYFLKGFISQKSSTSSEIQIRLIKLIIFKTIQENRNL